MSDNKTVPRHIGLILDGNRRWAKDRGLTSFEGHKAGSENLWPFVKQLYDRGVKVVSVYAFSHENWKRSKKEVSYLMKLIPEIMDKYISKAIEDDVEIIVAGDRSSLSESVMKVVRKAESTTLGNKKGIFVLCLNYGGRQEIINAVKTVIEGRIDPDCIDVEYFDQYLYGGREIGDIDIVVRTSGEQRLSGFMTWRTTYSELLFLDKHWPDMNNEDVDYILEEYNKRQRRHGA